MKPAVLPFVLAVGLTACTDSDRAADSDEQVVHVYNWANYISEDVIAAFEADTGIEVVYDVFDSNETLEVKILTGNSGYDVVVPSSTRVSYQVAAGAYRALDREKLPHYDNLDPELLEFLSTHDPGNAYSVPYTWYTEGFAYNVQRIAEIDPDAPVDSLRMLLDPEIVARFAHCGVTFYDSPITVLRTTLVYLGKPAQQPTAADVELAWQHLESIRPHIRYVHGSKYINDLANSEICVAMCETGDAYMATNRVREAGLDYEIAYTIPKEGSFIYFEVLAIPGDAPHPDSAHAFIDYLLRPEAAAANTNAIGYPNANLAATALLEPRLRDDPMIYPTSEVRRRLVPAEPLSPEQLRAWQRAWTRFKTGH